MGMKGMNRLRKCRDRCGKSFHTEGTAYAKALRQEGVWRKAFVTGAETAGGRVVGGEAGEVAAVTVFTALRAVQRTLAFILKATGRLSFQWGWGEDVAISSV